MEPAGRIIGKLKLPKGVIDPDAFARSAWPAAVGKKIAVHTRAIKLVRSTLIVECEDALWQRQLFTLSGQILRNLEGLAPGLVTDLDLRPMTPRRGMQYAEAPKAQRDMADEANRIEDAGFRLIYKQARRKASA